MKRTSTAIIAAIALTAMLGTPLGAQGTQLSGTIAERFGQQIVVTTPEGRLLVTLPEGAEVPGEGARVSLDGTRDGDTFAATALTVTGTAEARPVALPQPLSGLGLTDIRIRPDDDGETYIYARLPGGGWLRAEARGDRLIEVQSDIVGLPESLVAAMLPEAARAEPRFADIARLTEIELDEGEISVEGYAADGMRIEIEFGRNGDLRDYERERDDRRSLSDAAARERLEALGYTQIGFLERGGRDVEALALNPFGDQVEVRLDDQGRVERERLWTQ
ncbi:prevent-host-death protein [Roseicitreum antarcticum]|uniref:Uncharacterized protein n=1 Tax=Roseicitreum antarcticum TaxID=564137 RepID=A0A1H2Z078_9RHOB|nr:prevent-host-death protein [Roseicitreum antarcticum]SDX10823.1 hypothetical protein SAMN04488238_105202 [Roseicitreum antarcticum]